MSESINLGRRRLFKRRRSDAIRPPWTRTDVEFTDICTRCDACCKACGPGILVRGDGGFPEVKFDEGECTFCRKCVDSCPEPLFDLTKTRPWTLKASIDDSCLANQGTCCQSCKDACDAQAIRFTPRLGGAPQPSIDPDACTGCGACVAPCPVSAITNTNSQSD
jgi:ferredoxin-type protein NapF